jgi:hypothetical protein
MSVSVATTTIGVTLVSVKGTEADAHRKNKATYPKHRSHI